MTNPTPNERSPRPQPEATNGPTRRNGRDGAGDGFGGGSGGGAGGPGGAGGSGSGNDGGFRGKKVTTCSFCGKTSREVGPMVEGPNDVYICTNCTDLCANIFKQERRRVSGSRPQLGQIPSPRQMKEFLDQYVIGQETAKQIGRHV